MQRGKNLTRVISQRGKNSLEIERENFERHQVCKKLNQFLFFFNTSVKIIYNTKNNAS